MFQIPDSLCQHPGTVHFSTSITQFVWNGTSQGTQTFVSCEARCMHVIEVAIPFVIVKTVLKEHWSEFKEIMKINHFIHAAIWPLGFLNKYFSFFLHPSSTCSTKRNIFPWHDGIQIQKLYFHLLIPFFWFNKLQIWSMKGVEWSLTKNCKANRASLPPLLF